MRRLTAVPVALLLLAGCASDPAPRSSAPGPAPSPSTSPATSPASAAAPLPPPRATGVAGEAERGVLAYYEGLNRMLLTADTAPYRAVFTPACTACREFADSLEPLFADGRRLEGAQDVVRSVRVVLGPGGSAVADVAYTVTAHRLVDAQGAEVDRFPAEEAAATLTLARQPDGTFRVVGSRDATAG